MRSGVPWGTRAEAGTRCAACGTHRVLCYASAGNDLVDVLERLLGGFGAKIDHLGGAVEIEQPDAAKAR